MRASLTMGDSYRKSAGIKENSNSRSSKCRWGAVTPAATCRTPRVAYPARCPPYLKKAEPVIRRLFAIQNEKARSTALDHVITIATYGAEFRGLFRGRVLRIRGVAFGRNQVM